MSEQGSDAQMSDEQRERVDRQLAEDVEDDRKEEAAVAAQPTTDETEAGE